MLACIQRYGSSQRLACTPKSLDVPTPPLLLSVPPLQPCSHKAEPTSIISRYPSPAELDAFAQKTANSPLSIKIFPSDVRVPQHKQLNKMVNGLDTTGQRYSPYAQPYSGGYRGLLATVRASAMVKGAAKNSESLRRTKQHANGQASAAAAPYNNPLSNGYAVRHGHKAYHVSSCKPPDVPIETLCSSAGMPASIRDQSLAEVHSLMRQMSRVPRVGGEARASPSLQAVAAVAHCPDSDSFDPQSSLAFTGAVIPTQSADVARAGYLEKGDYVMAAWQHKHQIQQPQQSYQQEAVRMYGLSNSARDHITAAEAPETIPVAHPSQLSYRHQHPAGTSSLNCGEFSVGQYFSAPLWDGVMAAPSNNSDCYTSQVLATGTCAAMSRDLPLSHQNPHHHHHHHPHLHPNCHPHHEQHHQLQRHQLQLHPLPPSHHHPPPTPTHTQAYSGADQNQICCGLPASSLCHAAALSSSSLQSLECLISEIQAPCIKERMLGRGYQAMVGMPPQMLLEHQQQVHHIQLPVYR